MPATLLDQSSLCLQSGTSGTSVKGFSTYAGACCGTTGLKHLKGITEMTVPAEWQASTDQLYHSTVIACACAHHVAF